MNKDTSTYLDCARFLAAFTVMLCHIDEFIVKGISPFADHLGIEAVGVFFVLSGFVIGYATQLREKDLRTYAINRAARLYSVVIPCLTATLVLDTFGRHFLHSFYYGPQTFLREAEHIAFSFTFLNYSWLLPHAITPGNDGPFWSLCYEVPYYLMFGALWFLRGYRRWLVPVIVVLLFKPDVLTFFPLWLAGLGLYHVLPRIALKPVHGRAILALSALLWAGFELLLKYFDVCPNIQADINAAPILLYGAGLCFALSVAGFRFSGISLGRIASPIRWLAGATFTLYLLHFPLAWVLNSAMMLTPIGTWPASARWALLVAVTFSLVLAAAQVTERRKDVWRRGIDVIFAMVERAYGIGAEIKLKKENRRLL